jgi:glyoxylase-like metal-dependent hydrolase (beta-lactamase superfamily II)
VNRVKANSAAPVHHIGIPNPMFEGELNMYVIAGDPLTLVDTGIGTPEAMTALEEGLTALGFKVEDVRQVVLTHKHADHIGLARDIRDRSGATVYIHEDDWEGVAELDSRHGDFIPLVRRRLAQFHTPDEEIEKLTSFLGHGKRFARETPAEKLRDGDSLEISGEKLEVIHTPGHTQGCICLRYGDYLFSGDTVLPTISPNIGAGEMRRTGMVQRFLDSLDRVAALDGAGLTVLPGHGPPFTNLAERAAVLKGHHLDRERKILDVLKNGGPQTVYEISRNMWSKLPGYHLALATNEVNSHLEKSLADGAVREENGRFTLVE